MKYRQVYFRIHSKYAYSNGWAGKANLYVSQLINELIADGRLITAHTKSSTGIRTATEKERQEYEPPLVDKDFLARLAG